MCSYTSAVTFIHNEGRNSGYGMFCFGWGWGAQLAAPGVMGDCTVYRNRSSGGLMGLANGDGAPFDFWGPQDGTAVLAGNTCGSMYSNIGYYFDNGTANWSDPDSIGNVMSDPGVYLARFQASNIDAHDNTFVGYAHANCSIVPAIGQPNNAIITTFATPLAPAALAIILASGRE